MHPLHGQPPTSVVDLASIDGVDQTARIGERREGDLVTYTEDQEGRVGFVGLGAMGSRMVARLSDTGHQVLAYDVDPDKRADSSWHPGVSAARSLADLETIRLTICMLPDSDAVEQVVSGASGLFEILNPGSMIIDMGSSAPERTRRLAAEATRRELELVDAPVSGGVARAGTGELTTMFGGTSQQLERCRPLLDSLAGSIVHIGPVGAGHAMKALNNVMSAVGLTIACEVLEVGMRFGLEPSVVLDVLNHSTGRNHATETKIEQYVVSRSFDSGFRLSLMVKDLATAAELAREVGAATPVADSCLILWKDAADRLSPDADQTMIAEVLAGMGD